MHDGVGEHPTGAGITVHQLTAGCDLFVGEHVLVAAPGERGQQSHVGLALPEHVSRPFGGRQHGRVDAARPARPVHHGEKAGEGVGAAAIPAFRVDQMGLHVDDIRLRTAVKDLGRRGVALLGVVGDGEEPSPRFDIETAEDGRGGCPAGDVGPHVQRLAAGHAADGVVDVRPGPKFGWTGRYRRVLVGGPTSDQARIGSAPAHATDSKTRSSRFGARIGPARQTIPSGSASRNSGLRVRSSCRATRSSIRAR